MTAKEAGHVLETLRHGCADKEGHLPFVNDVQRAIWIDVLAPFTADAVRAACTQWLKSSRFWPHPSDIKALLEGPQATAEQQAVLAWTGFEGAVRRAGRYRGATFADGAIGETVRQVFGSWTHACSYDFDSPGWAIKRQTWLSVYPICAPRATGPVTLRGEFAHETPLLIAHTPGLPEPKAKPLAEKSVFELDRGEARTVLASLTSRLVGRQEAS